MLSHKILSVDDSGDGSEEQTSSAESAVFLLSYMSGCWECATNLSAIGSGEIVLECCHIWYAWLCVCGYLSEYLILVFLLLL